jgi:hypothetical protein
LKRACTDSTQICRHHGRALHLIRALHLARAGAIKARTACVK